MAESLSLQNGLADQFRPEPEGIRHAMEETVVLPTARDVNINSIGSVHEQVITDKYTDIKLDKESSRSVPSAQCEGSNGCCLHGSMRYLEKLVIARKFTEVKVNINDEAARRIRDKNFDYGDAVKCLTKLEWGGKDMLEHCTSKVRLEVKDRATELLEHVIKTIIDEPNLKRLMALVKNLFQKFQISLRSIHWGSLVFVMQHSKPEEMQRVLNTRKIQLQIQMVLLEFLPEWVADVAEWTVSPYTDTDTGHCQLRRHQETLCIGYSLEEDACTQWRTMRLVEECSGMMEKMQSMMADMLQAKSEQQRESRDTQIVSSHSVQLDGSRQSENEGSEEHKDSREGTEHNDPTKLKTVTVQAEDSDSDPITHSIASPFGGDGQSKSGSTEMTEPEVQYQSEASWSEKKTPDDYPTDERDIHKEKQVNVHGRTQKYGAPSQHTYRHQVATAAPALFEEQYTGSPSVYKQGTGPSDFSSWNPDVGKKPSSTDSGFAASDVQDKMDRHKEFVAIPQIAVETVETQKSVNVMHGGDVDMTDDDTPKENDSCRDDSKATDASPKKPKESKTQQAEHLLNWVNVKSNASQSQDPEIQRMMEQVELALEDEDDPAPRSRALDTILVLDTSDSVVGTHLDELKATVHTFVDGIEEMVDVMNLEENLAIVQMGDRAWVQQHLTNDYSRVRDVIDEITPDSETMRTGGRSPIFQALMVCLGAIEGRGGVVNVAGCHKVRPRIIFFTDGRPTDEATERGSDTQSSINEVKFALVQLISEFVSKKHKTTPAPIFWVPVGKDPDHAFLKSLAELSRSTLTEPDNVTELCRYYKVQETIGCVYKMVKKHADQYQTVDQIRPIVEALASNLEAAEKEYILEEVQKKQKEPDDSEPGDADDFDNVFEDKELVEAGSLPPLGTRVVRGKDWKWNNQDTEGPGTVIQHRKKRDDWLHVMWDNGSHNAYRYGDGNHYDVKKTDDHPRHLSESEFIEIGVEVERGIDWKDGENDGNGTGVVIRKRKDGKVKVRWWNTGHIGKYRYGADGKFEVKIVEGAELRSRRPSGSQTATPAKEEEEPIGAEGGWDPAKGPPRTVWYWRDLQSKEWCLYDEATQDKLLDAYSRRKDGSCVIQRDGKNRRVLFKTKQEKTVDKGIMHEVRSEVMSEQEYRDKIGLPQ